VVVDLFVNYSCINIFHLPQSPQKQLVMDLPLAAVKLISFGDPVTLKAALGTTMLWLYMEPV
jgi:hypothetical protein